MDKGLFKEEKAQWTITTPIDVKRKLAKLAKKNRRSLAAEIRIAIDNYLESERKRKVQSEK
jgi:predicted transcriptional regulator